jgi:hypothetical protein
MNGPKMINCINWLLATWQKHIMEKGISMQCKNIQNAKEAIDQQMRNLTCLDQQEWCSAGAEAGSDLA